MFKIDSKESLREALIKLAERPGLYVGTDRFDYLDNFSAGWGLVTPEYPWNADYEIQEWIFLKESVSIANAASLHGRSLISRCYGNRIEAINKFKMLLEEVEFSSNDAKKEINTVSAQIFGLKSCFESAFEEDDYICPFANLAPATLKQASKKLVGKVQNTYESIIPIIVRMINESHDDLWVYLHYETYFLSVRFLYRTIKGEWQENTVLSNREDYFQNLLILHAYASFVQKKEHTNHIITLRHNQGVTMVDCKETVDATWHDILNAHNEKPLYKSYAEWKEDIML